MSHRVELIGMDGSHKHGVVEEEKCCFCKGKPCFANLLATFAEVIRYVTNQGVTNKVDPDSQKWFSHPAHWKASCREKKAQDLSQSSSSLENSVDVSGIIQCIHQKSGKG